MGERRTAAGGLLVGATLLKVGVTTPLQSDGRVLRILHPAEEIFAREALVSLANLPVTLMHPLRADGRSGLVTPTNWRSEAVGHVAGLPHRAGACLEGDVAIDAFEALEAIERGDAREVSCTYTCDHEVTPGVFDGKRYDVIARRIRFNHVALGPAGWGSGGPEVCLHLDGSAARARQEERPMERVLRYDTTASGESTMTIMRRDIESAGLQVPRDASPAFVEGMWKAARTAPRADAPRVRVDPLATSALLADPFALLMHTERAARADTEYPTAARQESSDPRDRMFAKQKDAWRQPRRDRRSTTPTPSNATRIPTTATEHPAPNSFRSNPGETAGEPGETEGVFDGAETRAAQDKMLQRQKDAWMKTRRVHGRARERGLNGSSTP